MSSELSTFLLILGLSSSVASPTNEKSCKKVCITVNTCATDGTICDDLTGPKYSKCQIKCNRVDIMETIEKIELNNIFNYDEKPNMEQRNGVIDDDEVREEFKELLRAKSKNRKKDFDAVSKYTDDEHSAIIVADDEIHPGNVEFIRQTLNMANKMILNGRSANKHFNPYERVQHTASKVTIYPDLLPGLFDTTSEERLRNNIRKFLGNENLPREKNLDILGVLNKTLGLLNSPLENSRRVKRTIPQLGGGIGGAAAGGAAGRLAGNIGGGLGLGPGGLMAGLSGSASGEASGYAQGMAGAGAGTPGYGYPGYSAYSGNPGYPAYSGNPGYPAYSGNPGMNPVYAQCMRACEYSGLRPR
ncbi:uncharacterized protein [Rhodnius prolixus]|uniref:uncharacterized protein n=1 Tax=Rhodnius prolixus TaxID=13249 RepID=UPI003D189347